MRRRYPRRRRAGHADPKTSANPSRHVGRAGAQPELGSRLGVARPAHADRPEGHRPGDELREPERHVSRRAGAEDLREPRDPLALRRGLVVGDVVDARCAVVEREDGRGRRVVDVDEREAAVARRRRSAGGGGARPRPSSRRERAARLRRRSRSAGRRPRCPGVFSVASSRTRIASTASRVLAGGSRKSGADSSRTHGPSGSSMNDTLCEITRRAPASAAARATTG